MKIFEIPMPCSEIRKHPVIRGNREIMEVVSQEVQCSSGSWKIWVWSLGAPSFSSETSLAHQDLAFGWNLLTC